MRLLQVVADGTPGGGTTNVLALTEDLRARGVEVAFCSQANSYATERAAELGAEVIGEIDFFAGRMDVRAPRQLAEVVQAARADVVHLHGGRAAFFYARARPPAEQLSAYTVRGYHFVHKIWPLRMLQVLAERRSSLTIDQTVLVCQHDQRLAARYRLLPAGKRGIVIPNGIRLGDIPPLRDQADPKRVAVLGRLTLQKDPHLVLNLAKQLAGEGFVFDLIGGGDLEAEVRRRIAAESIANVNVYGSLPRDEALQAMRNCGAFLLASRWEGLPIAPVEALQMGQAVVVSDVSGNPEVIQHERTGFVVPQPDVDGYAKALRRLAADADLRDRFRVAGQADVAKRFTRERVLDEYLTMYEELRLHGTGR